MKITKVSVNKGHTINMGNFNSAKFSFGVEAELGEGDNSEGVRRKIEAIVDKWNEEEFDAQMKNKNG